MDSMPEKKRRGRKPLISPQEEETLRRLVTEQPAISLRQIAKVIKEQHGQAISPATLGAALKHLGFRKIRAEKQPIADTPKDDTRRYQPIHRREPTPGKYPSSLTDGEWEALVPLVVRVGGRGRPPLHERRLMWDAVFYLIRSGGSWRMLPQEYPSYKAVFAFFARARDSGLLDRVLTRLHELWRERSGRPPQPSVGIVDSQSVKTSEQGGLHGFDAGKKVNGRKRFVVVDTLGLPIAVLVTAASTHEQTGGADVIADAKKRSPNLTKVWGDGAFAGKCIEIVREQTGINLEIVLRPNAGDQRRWRSDDVAPEPITSGFSVLPHRWIVERTFAWLGHFRRLVRDYEHTITSSCAWILIAFIRIIIQRLGEQPA